MKLLVVEDDRALNQGIALSFGSETVVQAFCVKEARELFQIKPGDHLILLADINKGMAIPPKQHFEEFYNKLFENNIK